MAASTFGGRSPFDGPYSVYLLLGLTDDHFCLPDTRLVDLDTYLRLHLRALGFRAVAFHHPREGVSGARFEAEAPPPRPPAANRPALASVSRRHGLAAGPLGHIRVLGGAPPAMSATESPSASATVDTDGRFAIPRMAPGDLPGWLESYFAEDGRRAFVFKDLAALRDFDQRAVMHLWAVLRTARQRGGRDKKVVFVSAYRRLATLQRHEEAGELFRSFADELLHEEAPLPSVIRIESPGMDEVLNAQRRLRVRGGLAAERPAGFLTLAGHCEALAMKLRAVTDASMSTLKHNLDDWAGHDWAGSLQTDGALTRLAALPGRGDVADRIRRDVDHARSLRDEPHDAAASNLPTGTSVERLLRPADAGLPPAVNLSYALVGRPGTGKTIVARLIGQAFKEAGILRSGHFIQASVPDLVSGYVGQTAMKANDLLGRARGGVLFIDEVQGFDKDNQFHQEAVRTLLTYVEDYRGDISVIVATYPAQFDTFLEIDPGLARRFAQRIELEDYSADECVEILEHMNAEMNAAHGARFDVSPELRPQLAGFFEAWIRDRTKKEGDVFANAGSVRNLLEDMRRAAGAREAGQCLLTADDVPEDRRDYLRQAERRSGSVEDRVRHALAELEAMPGLHEVKSAVAGIVNAIRAARLRGESDLQRPGHYSFEGNPGTGKTTVARLLGELFCELGVLKSGHVVEVTRSTLVAQYVGQTAPRVREQAERARDGVLFIDEAHNLMQGDRDEFGKEAIGELTAVLENERDHLCVIIAGYPAQIDGLFAADPGWESRFSRRMHFEDFEAEEMEQVMRYMCNERKRTLHPDVDGELRPMLRRLRDREHLACKFSNGRSVRNLLDEMQGRLDRRVVEAHAEGEDVDPRQFILDDAPAGLRV